MTPLLSDRYQLEIRLDRHGDVVEWLGTDSALERPVLVRILDPAADDDRIADFLDAVRAAAAVGHVHLSAVYAADRLDAGGAYVVQEWAGGVTLADRLDAGEPLPLEDFLPNAAGLAAGLGALHEAGLGHGAIDAHAVLFAAAHPAKLTAYGRTPGGHRAEPADDVAALAAVLVAAATGRPVGSGEPAPSEIRAGLPAQVDRALARAAAGELDAAGLAAALRAAPTARRDRARSAWSWQVLAAAGALLAIAVAIAAVGLALRVRPSDSRLLFNASPTPTRAAADPPVIPADTPTTTAPATGGAEPLPAITSAAAYDPFGDAQERDGDVPLALDGDPATGWRTERYLDPLGALKGGVGLVFDLDRPPGSVELLASDGTDYAIGWSPTVPASFDEWEMSARGRTVGGRAQVQLPHHDGGSWLLWLTDLPAQEGGEFYYAHVYEVRFRP